MKLTKLKLPIRQTPIGNWILDARRHSLDFCRDAMMEGKQFLTFTTKNEAIQKVEEMESFISNYGARLNNAYEYISIDKKLKLQALELNDTYKLTIQEAVAIALKQLKTESDKSNSPILKDVIKLFLDEKFNNKSNLALKTKAATVNALKLLTSIEDKKIKEITADDISNILDNLNVETNSKNSYLVRIKVLFNWLVKKEYLAKNVLNNIEIKRIRKNIQHYSLEETSKLLRFIIEKYPEMLGFFVIGLFAGCRPGETSHLKYDNIKNNHIEILSHTSKTRTGRLIKMENNLIKWIEYIKSKYPDMPLIPTQTNVDKIICNISRNENILYIKDGLRHTFATFHLAKHKNFNELEYLCGNSKKILQKHYLGLETEENAIKYFNILPENIIIDV